MLHTKDNCTANDLIISATCGLQCGNCLACKCGKCAERAEHNTTEVIRCIDFIVQQFRKGYTAEEVAQQALNSYGFAIYTTARHKLAKSLKD